MKLMQKWNKDEIASEEEIKIKKAVHHRSFHGETREQQQKKKQ